MLLKNITFFHFTDVSFVSSTTLTLPAIFKFFILKKSIVKPIYSEMCLKLLKAKCPSCTPWLTSHAFCTVKVNPLAQLLKEVGIVQNIIIEKVFLSRIHFIGQNVDRIWQICIKLLWKVSAHSVLEGTAAQQGVMEKYTTAKKIAAAVRHQESIKQNDKSCWWNPIDWNILKLSINCMWIKDIIWLYREERRSSTTFGVFVRV